MPEPGDRPHEGAEVPVHEFDPEHPIRSAGQTIADVIRAKEHFTNAVRQRHPDSPKPAMIGNCQGGWAAMILAAASPDVVGPLVINGAPMSYWSGHLDEGPGKNPMRYLGGLLGGSWGALLASDLGNGKVDGADVSVELKEKSKKETTVKATARKMMLPKADIAGGVVYQIEQAL